MKNFPWKSISGTKPVAHKAVPLVISYAYPDSSYKENRFVIDTEVGEFLVVVQRSYTRVTVDIYNINETADDLILGFSRKWDGCVDVEIHVPDSLSHTCGNIVDGLFIVEALSVIQPIAHFISDEILDEEMRKEHEEGYDHGMRGDDEKITRPEFEVGAFLPVITIPLSLS